MIFMPSIRIPITLIIVVLLILCSWIPVGADLFDPGQWEIISTKTVLSECRTEAGVIQFTDTSGEDWELITNCDDRQISNPGQGHFYPIDESVVRAVLSELSPFFRSNLSCRIYILPYPRRGLVRSSCDGTSIYLSPGVRPYTHAEIHCLLCHEIGHLVHRQLITVALPELWQHYRFLRGITDSARFNRSAVHGDQPEEIFAEDFRKLCGTEAGRSFSVNEVSSAPPIQTRSGLVAFFRTLFLPAGQLSTRRLNVSSLTDS